MGWEIWALVALHKSWETKNWNILLAHWLHVWVCISAKQNKQQLCQRQPQMACGAWMSPPARGDDGDFIPNTRRRCSTSATDCWPRPTGSLKNKAHPAASTKTHLFWEALSHWSLMILWTHFCLPNPWSWIVKSFYLPSVLSPVLSPDPPVDGVFPGVYYLRTDSDEHRIRSTDGNMAASLRQWPLWPPQNIYRYSYISVTDTADKIGELSCPRTQ